MRNLAALFIIAGIILLGIGGYQFFKLHAAEQQAMKDAKELFVLPEKEKSPISETNSESKSTADNFAPDTGEIIGLLEIPSINAELPIVEGTDPDELEKGVGHYKGSAFPKQNDQVVLSGHRDTVFRKLGEVEIGDTFTVKLAYGEFKYKMMNSKIVVADDTTVIHSTAPNEELVLTTCYPFSYIGDAPDRYIIYAKPIE
ncbi:class D sortase [Gracilibacillus sp. YIM 98692]|uniref:class D sortase n=1 Tax=Gracilibacillus sp. YIM 98692 TaxID=2663532 RepID=UPI0013CF6DB4|nr:class D sortase [Gracilibacillus sp. YIM 98692]